MAEYFVDIQGYRAGYKTYIIKELAIISYDGAFLLHSFLKAPFEFDSLPEHYKKQARWNLLHFHRIPWEFGSVNIQNLRRQLGMLPPGSTMYVKGEEKSNIIRQTFNKFNHFNIVELPKNPSLKKMQSHNQECFFHKDIDHCALNNVFKIKNTFINYWSK